MTLDANTVTPAANLRSTQVSTTLIRSTLAYASIIGQNPQQLLTLIELKEDDLLDPDGHVSEVFYDRIIHHASLIAKDPFFGLHLGEKHSLRHMGILGFLVMNSATFREALQAYEKFQSAFGESMEMKMEERADCCHITLLSHGGELSGRHRIESFASSLQAAAFELTGNRLPLRKVTLSREMPRPADRYIEVLGLMPVKAAQDTVEFDRIFLDSAIVNSFPEMNYFFEEKLNAVMRNKEEFELTRRIKREIARRLGKSLPISLQDFAKSFAVSTRSLQLKLQEEGTSFSNLHEDVQKEFAMGFLRAGRPITEISYALGFSEPSAFQRAFKRWTGASPAQYRNALG